MEGSMRNPFRVLSFVLVLIAAGLIGPNTAAAAPRFHVLVFSKVNITRPHRTPLGDAR
jgi:hypothetical protein